MPARRLVALAAVLVTFSIAPAAWAVDTLGHATSSTFPAGGSAGGISGGSGTGPQAGAFGRGRPGSGGAPSGLAGLFGGGGPPGGGFAGGRPGGGSDSELSSAVRYADSHGGGTVAVSSQSDADDEIIDHGADVAGIGGLSGNESADQRQLAGR